MLEWGGREKQEDRGRKKSNQWNVKYALKIEQDTIFECPHLSYEKYFNILLQNLFLSISWLVQTLLAWLYVGAQLQTASGGALEDNANKP